MIMLHVTDVWVRAYFDANVLNFRLQLNCRSSVWPRGFLFIYVARQHKFGLRSFTAEVTRSQKIRDTHTHTQTLTHTDTHAHTFTHKRTHRHSHTHSHTQAHTDNHTHTHTHMRTHSHTLTHTHTQTDTHTPLNE
jgi:carbohydrate-binding DOMON domain-containing protein